jgi:hypothetical protein
MHGATIKINVEQCCYLEIFARPHEAWILFHDSVPARDMLLAFYG